MYEKGRQSLSRFDKYIRVLPITIKTDKYFCINHGDQRVVLHFKIL